MKLVTIVALILLINGGLYVGDRGLRVWSSTTADQWNRICRYYYPIRIFEIILPLSQDCPSWAPAR